MKRFQSLFLALAILAGTTSAWADDSGTCGAVGNEANVTWSYVESTHTLTIEGTGEMHNYGGSYIVPWDAYKTAITSVSLPVGLTTIGTNAFNGCSNLTSINIPTNVASIGPRAFNGCSNLTSINIPTSVTIIGARAFNGCSGLTSISVATGNTIYDSRDNCNAIIETSTNKLIRGCKNTSIPSTVTNIGSDAFNGCTKISTVVIPSGVTAIGASAFADCSKLRTVTIPASVLSIGSGVFENCEMLSIIDVKWTTTPLPTPGSNAFNGVNTSQVELKIPDDTRAMYEANAVWRTFSINDRDFHTGTFGTNLTWEFNKLTETLTISGSGDMPDYSSGYAPWDDYKSGADPSKVIRTVIIGDGVTSIGTRTFFYYPNLTDVTIGSNVSSIYFSAFQGCENLTSVTISATTAPWIGISSVFIGCSDDLKITFPCGCRESYASTWSAYADKLISECTLTTVAEIYTTSESVPTISLKRDILCNNWMVSGKYTLTSPYTYECAYITDGENGFLLNLDASSLSLAVGDQLNGLIIDAKVWKMSANPYADVRIPGADVSQLTVTHDGVITPLVKTIDQLSGINTGAPVTIKGLKCTEKTADVATMTDGTSTTINVATRLFDDALDYLEVGKYYDITGIFQSSIPSNPHRIFPRSATDIVALPPVAQVTTAASVTTPYYTFTEALAAWEENSTLKLLAPVEITDRIEVTTTCTLDLNGYGIKSSGDHEVFFLNTHGGTFTLDDSNTGNQTHRYKQNPSDVFAALNETEGEIVLSGGYITSGRGNMTETTSSSIRDGGAFFVLETTFIMNGGNIIGNYVWRHGAGVFIAKGSHFIMNGGRITHNYANLAGAVSVYANVTDINDNASSTMEMHGGEISYNFAKYNSGGIHSNSASASMYATITIDGGSIINNHVDGSIDQHCGGIGIGGYSQIHISGNPTISGNTFGDVVENIYIYSGSTLIIDGELTNTTPLPVTLETSGVFTSGLSGNGTATNFAMENTGTYLVTNRNGEAAILAPMAVTANADPNDLSTRYSTFYDGTIKYVVPAGVEVYTAEISGTDMLLHLIASAGDVLPWDEAVILKTADAALELIPTDDAPTAASAANVLLGTDVAMAAPENCYVLSGGSTATYGITGIGFYLYTNTLAAHKAYLIYSSPNPAPKRFRFVFDETTDIEEVDSRESIVDSQKVLRDGVLYIQRGEHIYNANGQMIK